MASRIKIDLVVVGSVAVDRLGRRIGKGEGFADLEFAMAASHHNAVTPETVIITTVHDIQVFDELPKTLFKDHDIPVDIIVTPTEVFRVNDRLPKPDHIMWNMISREKFEQIPILRELQFKEQKSGKNVTLKDEENDEKSELNNVEAKENGNKSGKKKPYNSKNKRPKPAKNEEKSDKTENAVENGKNENKSKRGPRDNNRKENGKKAPENGKKTVENGKSPARNGKGSDKKDEIADAEATTKPNNVKKAKQYPPTVSVFVGKIPRGTRVKELKDVIIAQGIKPINILWKGGKGYALIYCEKKDISTSDELHEKLKDLKIGDNVLNVEPDKRMLKQQNNENNDAKKDATKSAPKIEEAAEAKS